MENVKIGFCKCCGKTVKLINPKGSKQSEWDTIATNMCECQKRKRGKKAMHKEKLTLATICGGAVQEKVDRALEKVARNILDPNVAPDKKRSVTLKITLKPSDEDQEDVIVSADVTYQLAPELGVSTNMFVSKDLKSGNIHMMEHRRGEIKGQLDFSDVGIVTGDDEMEDFDPETGEILQEESATDILDFRKVKEG